MLTWPRMQRVPGAAGRHQKLLLPFRTPPLALRARSRRSTAGWRRTAAGSRPGTSTSSTQRGLRRRRTRPSWTS